jgi:hypothetical protein
MGLGPLVRVSCLLSFYELEVEKLKRNSAANSVQEAIEHQKIVCKGIMDRKLPLSNSRTITTVRSREICIVGSE